MADDMNNDELVVVENNENLDTEALDETAAADTLQPEAGAWGTESRAATLSTFTQLLANLGKEDLSDLFNQVQAQYGPNADLGVGDNSSKNKASLNSSGAAAAEPMPTLSVKEDVEEMFAADDLSEEFKERAEVVFEAALNTRLTLEREALVEEFEKKELALEEAFEVALEEASTEIFSEISEKLNQYLDYSINEWMEENRLAIDNGLRAEIAENFIEGLHTLFAEHYITVPETKLDIVAEMKETIDNLSAQLEEATDKTIELESLVAESRREEIIDELTEGLVISQAEKLRSLVEGIEYSDEESFKRKANIIKENYFSKGSPTDTGLLTEESITDTVPVSDNMSKYVAAAGKLVKK